MFKVTLLFFFFFSVVYVRKYNANVFLKKVNDYDKSQGFTKS